MNFSPWGCALALLLTFPSSQAETPGPEMRYSAEQLQQDFRFLQGAIAKTHPGVAFSTDLTRLHSAYEEVEARLQQPLDRDQAWRVLARLNPVFADAHLVVSQPAMLENSAAFLKEGGALFPYEVHVDGAGDVFIRSDLGGPVTALNGARIETINGVPARRVVSELLALTHGDAPAFRANLLSLRWWFLYWKNYGAPRQFDLVVERKDGSMDRFRKPASTLAPAMVKDRADFDQAFKFELLPNKAALLTINSFLWPDKERFYAFAGDVFARLHDAGTATLLIDVRANPGGDDDMWKRGILRYIADKPYRHGSTYVKKVIEGRQGPTEQVGDVVEGAISTWEQPELNNPLHFSGKTYVLVGSITYSSAILFSNTMQDFGFAKLVGAGGYARTRQSGGTQTYVLPHTGLNITAPRFILDRPSGIRQPPLVRPDIILPDSPFDRRALIDAFLAGIAKDSQRH